jgi:hypothetical protein
MRRCWRVHRRCVSVEFRVVHLRVVVGRVFGLLLPFGVQSSARSFGACIRLSFAYWLHLLQRRSLALLFEDSVVRVQEQLWSLCCCFFREFIFEFRIVSRVFVLCVWMCSLHYN